MSLTLEEFKNKYLGKQVEFHSYGAGAFNQCVDLVNAYINECLDNNTKDYTEIIGTDAKDFNTKYDKEDFYWVPNTPNGVPWAGDIPVWNGKVGKGAGHVAVCVEKGNTNNFKSIDQNWSQKEKVTEEIHNYNNVSGWLRPVGSKPKDDCEDIKKQLSDMRDSRDKWRDTAKIHEGNLVGLNSQVSLLTIESEGLKFKNKIITEQAGKVLEDFRALEILYQVTKEKADANLMSYSWNERFRSLFKGGE